jgi:uncharacterized membrane protein
MIKLPFLALLSIVLFDYCGSNTTNGSVSKNNTTPAVVQDIDYTGMYMQGSNGRTFFDCVTNQLYTVKDETRALDSLYTKLQTLRKPYDNEPILVLVKGAISIAPANNGTPSNAQGILLVKKVDSISSVGASNCCLPFEFMAFGNEPFWSLQLFPAGKNIVFSVVGDTVATLALSPAVQIMGDTKTYNTTTSDGKPLKITIKKSETSDGMSDFIYPYEAEVILGKEKFKGVALGKGDKAKGME